MNGILRSLAAFETGPRAHTVNRAVATLISLSARKLYWKHF